MMKKKNWPGSQFNYIGVLEIYVVSFLLAGTF